MCSPDQSYVTGASTPGRAEHTVIRALTAFVAGGGDVAPRLGVCAIGGSGKSSACKGVASSAYVRDTFVKGTLRIQLDGTSTPETSPEAVVSLVCNMCGADPAKRLLQLKKVDDVVAAAARYIQAVPAAEAAKRIVVIDDVYDKKRDLLSKLLQVLPSSTPVIFTTRADSVIFMVGSAAQVVRIEALQDIDARLVLAKAMGRSVVARVDPFSPDEAWVGRVLHLVQRHALSLWLVGCMVKEKGGAIRQVLVALKRKQLMQPGFVLPDGGMGCWSAGF